VRLNFLLDTLQKTVVQQAGAPGGSAPQPDHASRRGASRKRGSSLISSTGATYRTQESVRRPCIGQKRFFPLEEGYPDH